MRILLILSIVLFSHQTYSKKVRKLIAKRSKTALYRGEIKAEVNKMSAGVVYNDKEELSERISLWYNRKSSSTSIKTLSGAYDSNAVRTSLSAKPSDGFRASRIIENCKKLGEQSMSGDGTFVIKTRGQKLRRGLLIGPRVLAKRHAKNWYRGKIRKLRRSKLSRREKKAMRVFLKRSAFVLNKLLTKEYIKDNVFKPRTHLHFDVIKHNISCSLE